MKSVQFKTKSSTISSKNHSVDANNLILNQSISSPNPPTNKINTT